MEKLKNCYENENKFIYVVNEGENLKSIAEKFNTTESIILKENSINSELSGGEFLYIERGIEVIVVKPNDTLLSISKKYNVSEDEILRKNKVDYIFVGQKLLIK